MKKLVIAIISILLFFKGSAQTDDLMIVEYVDWQGGSGWAVKIYNPTDQTINLNDYKISRYRDGDPSINAQADISGTLGPKQFKIFGNGDYCDDCSNQCNLVTGIVGTNGHDAIAITKGANDENVDMVGAWGVETDITVGGFNNFDALYQHKLTRNTDNCIRYVDLAGTSTNSWPDNANSNVLTWEVFPHSCLSTSNFEFDIDANQGLPDTTYASNYALCFDDSIRIDVNFSDVIDYYWPEFDVHSQVVYAYEQGIYELELTTNKLCKDKVYHNVDIDYCDTTIIPEPIDTSSEYMIPNIITPNTDIYNSAFVLKGFTEQVSITIYNKWGKKVYEDIDYKNDWKGDGLSDGTYFYKVVEGYVELRGWLEIRR